MMLQVTMRHAIYSVKRKEIVGEKINIFQKVALLMARSKDPDKTRVDYPK